jgi:hypothetical protein
MFEKKSFPGSCPFSFFLSLFVWFKRLLMNFPIKSNFRLETMTAITENKLFSNIEDLGTCD